MATKNPAVSAALKNLMQARIELAERLAAQLETWQQAQSQRREIDDRIATEAATARDIWDECLAAGWTAKELNTAGLKPPAAPRTRSAASSTADV